MSIQPAAPSLALEDAVDAEDAGIDRRDAHQQQVRDGEARFHAVVNAVQGIVWTNDAEGRMLGEQVGWASLTGQSPDEYQGYGWADAVHPDDVEPTLAAWQTAVAAAAPYRLEHRVRRHDGEWRRFSASAVPVLDDCGQLREWVGIHKDITEATEARLQLARNAETFTTLVRNSPFGIYIVDADFRFLEVSQGAWKAFEGIDPLIGRDGEEVFRLVWPEPFAGEVIERFRTTLATGESYVSTTVELRADRDSIEAYDWRIERIALPDGSDGVVCYFYDLSERVKLEADLRQALDHKELLTREIEHRVQNSLSIVAGLLTMQAKTADSAETREALAAASLRVLAIGRVHRQLYQGDNIGIVEFGAYLRQLCADVERTLVRPSLSFEVRADTVDLPVDTAIPLGIVANELLTNACKYCDPASAERVTVTLDAGPRTVTLTVTDTGPGVPHDFTPQTGSGLGLRVIKSLVKQIGGTIVYPKPGREARFEIRIPAP